MAKISDDKNKGRVKPKVVPAVSKKSVANTDFLDKIENFFVKNEMFAFVSLLLFSLLSGVFLFDVKLSIGLDDATYIQQAIAFVQEKIYPSFAGVLYPLFLSIPISIFGVNLIFLKVFSLLFSAGHFIFIFLAFRRRIPMSVLFLVLSFIACNHFIHYYDSQTYTESFFMFLQSVFIFFIFKLIDWIGKEGQSLHSSIKYWLICGFLVFLVTLAKNIAITAVVAFVFFFLLRKEFKWAAFAAGSFLLFKIPYEVILRSFRGATPGQLEKLLQKDFYNPSKGLEDFGGFINRFITNFQNYISIHLFRLMNLRPELKFEPTSTFLSLLVIAVFLFALWTVWKKNTYLFYLGLHIMFGFLTTFLVLQVNWNQDRLIIIYLPYFILFVFSALYMFAKKAGHIIVQGPLFFLMCLLVLLGFFSDIGKINKNMPVLKRNLAGDIYYGYTPDYANFLKMSNWASEYMDTYEMQNPGKKMLVASRKAAMSTIYGHGKKFFPVYFVKSDNADTNLLYFQKNKVTHVLIASLRFNTYQKTANVINTLHKMLKPIVDKYPEKVKMIHVEGDDEQSWLYEIKY